MDEVGSPRSESLLLRESKFFQHNHPRRKALHEGEAQCLSGAVSPGNEPQEEAREVSLAFCFCPLAALIDHIQFGDCHIGNSYNVSFTVTNHSQVNVIRFEWPLLATISFSPQVSENRSLFSGLP